MTAGTVTETGTEEGTGAIGAAGRMTRAGALTGAKGRMAARQQTAGVMGQAETDALMPDWMTGKRQRQSQLQNQLRCASL